MNKMELRKKIEKSKNILSKKGIIKTTKKAGGFLYRRLIRPLMPVYEYGPKKNKVDIGNKELKIGDKILPENFSPHFVHDFDEYYEYAISKQIRRNVREGERVVIVGGGMGVTAVIAARKVGNNGKVEVYEGSKMMYGRIKKTVNINRMEKTIDINDSIVGKEFSIRGGSSEAMKERTSVDELPECDVLELDCEGTEIEILKKMRINPRLIIVESHGMYGAHSDEMIRILRKRNYIIENVEKAVHRKDQIDRPQNFCIDNDIMVITALKKLKK